MKPLLAWICSSLLVAAAAQAPPRTPPPAGAPPAVAASSYIIGPGDVLEIDVWKQAEISRTLPVRPDGRISLPLAGTIIASGRTPATLQQAIAARLKSYISDPVVTVMVEKVGSRRFSVLGAVLRPGAYPLDGPVRVLEALAEAGGFTPFADPGSVTLLHRAPNGRWARYPFNYNDVIKGRHLDQDRLLQPGDTIVVP